MFTSFPYFKKFRLPGAAFLLFIMALAGCRKSKDSGENLPRYPLSIPLRLNVFPNPKNASGSVVLKFHTESLYPQSGYLIRHSAHISKQHALIVLRDVEPSLAGLQVFSSATCTVEIPLPDIGMLPVDVAAGDKVWYGSLSATADYFEFKGSFHNVINLEGPTGYSRIKPRTVYGFVQYAPGQEALAQTLTDSLYYCGLAGGAYKPGDYCYFTVNSDGSAQMINQPSLSIAVLGLMPDDESTLRDYLKRVRQNYPQVSFYLNTDKGLLY